MALAMAVQSSALKARLEQKAVVRPNKMMRKLYPDGTGAIGDVPKRRALGEAEDEEATEVLCAAVRKAANGIPNSRIDRRLRQTPGRKEMLVLSSSLISLLVLNEAKPYRSDGSGSYSPSRALLFAHFSNAAYCSAANISYWDCAPCRAADKDFVVSKVVSGGGMQGFVGQAPGNDIVVSFRGSDNIRNWIDNIDITKTDAYPKCDGCRVHTGFYKAWCEPCH
jgi:hypothetical protein